MIVTVVFKSQKKLIKIEKFSTETEGFEYKDFIYSALQGNGLSYEDFDCFTTCQEVVIAPELFLEYFQQHYTHPSFFICLKTKIEDRSKFDKGVLKRSNACIGPNLIINSESLQSYINQKGGDLIIKDYKFKGVLTNANRRQVVAFVASFIEENFGFSPPREAQIAAAEACCKLFPCLETKNDTKIDLLFNSKNNGFLQIKLKNNRVKRRRLESELTVTEDEEHSDKENEETDSNIIQKHLGDLEQASLPDQLDFVKDRLKLTISYRRKASKEKDFRIYEKCCYFFVCPDLISYDFYLTHNSNSLLKSWKTFQQHIFTVVNNSGKHILYTEPDREKDWDTTTLSVLNLLRLLPPPPNGKKRIGRLTDERAVDALLRHKKAGITNEEYLEGAANRAPYIIAIGLTKASIIQHFVILDSHIIPLPATYTFLHALDIVFQLHFLFNIEYDHNLRLFWMFIQKYIYEIEIPVTSIVLEVFQKLKTLLEPG